MSFMPVLQSSCTIFLSAYMQNHIETLKKKKKLNVTFIVSKGSSCDQACQVMSWQLYSCENEAVW